MEVEIPSYTFLGFYLHVILLNSTLKCILMTKKSKHYITLRLKHDKAYLKLLLHLSTRSTK